MDYKRIYDDFIKDRREKETALEGYTERHHIVPRSFGGGDEPSNLIRLTPEDHFFAHLLLAKIHGGKMASALHLMLQRPANLWRRRFSSRRAYGLAAKIVARVQGEAWSGEGNPLFNDTLHEWQNLDTGEKLLSRIFDMWTAFGGSRPSWTMVINGDKASVMGWTLADRYKGHKRNSKGRVRSFVNLDGRKFTGTQAEFMAVSNLSAAQVCRMVHSEAISRDGWRLDGVAHRHFNATRDGRSSGNAGRGRVYRLSHPVMGQFEGKIGDFAEVSGAKNRASARSALVALHSGRLQTAYGWRLAD